MVDKRDRGNLAADQNDGLRCSPERNRADTAWSYTGEGLPGYTDVDSYAMMVYRANIELGLADAQNEYNTPELRDLLTRASAASTVSRRRARRM